MMRSQLNMTRLRIQIPTAAMSLTMIRGAPFSAALAHADQVAYLINVTVRPRPQLSQADPARAHRNGSCDKVGARRRYLQIMADPMAAFATSDEFQASYLVAPAANESGPERIWQLRRRHPLPTTQPMTPERAR